MWRFAESLRKKYQQTDVRVAGVAVGHASTSVSKQQVMQSCRPPVLRRWENQRMLSSIVSRHVALSIRSTRASIGRSRDVLWSVYSAGVGRTGVFVTLSVVLERMRFEGVVDMFQTVNMLRTQRPFMVQSEVTLILVHGQVIIIFVVSVCLSVCLFVCLCRVFLSRL